MQPYKLKCGECGNSKVELTATCNHEGLAVFGKLEAKCCECSHITVITPFVGMEFDTEGSLCGPWREEGD